MMNYVPPPDEAKRRKRKREAKDPNAPKRPLSNHQRPAIAGKNPELEVPEIAKELARWWREAVSEVKIKYQTLAAENKAKYLDEKANDEGNPTKKAKGHEE